MGPSVHRQGLGPPPPVAGFHEVAVVSWNAHVGGGDLVALIGALREGTLSAGEPIPHSCCWCRRHSDPASFRFGLTLDYVFARLPERWRSETRTLDDHFGSDHRPLLARLRRQPER